MPRVIALIFYHKSDSFLSSWMDTVTQMRSESSTMWPLAKGSCKPPAAPRFPLASPPDRRLRAGQDFRCQMSMTLHTGLGSSTHSMSDCRAQAELLPAVGSGSWGPSPGWCWLSSPPAGRESQGGQGTQMHQGHPCPPASPWNSHV